MKTVRVRIAVAVDSKGKWCACGFVKAGKDVESIALEGLPDSDDPFNVVYVEANVPVPEGITVKGEVVE